MVTLKSSHLCLEKELVTTIFKAISYAYVTYRKEQKQLLVTPVSSIWFTKMYEPTQFLLKEKNLKGDRSLAIREILIDNELDMVDRALDYEVVEKTNLLKIYLE
ncbi:MAG: hypothetical protein RLO12_06085 [Fulvivirga sp.]